MEQDKPPSSLRVLLIQDKADKIPVFRQICEQSSIPVEIKDTVMFDEAANYLLSYPDACDILVCDYSPAQKIIRKHIEKTSDIAEIAGRAKNEFLSNMSHEIRTPMNAVIGMIDLAMGTQLTPEQRDFLQTAKTSANLLLTLLNDILDFAGLESGRIRLEEENFYFHRLWNSIIQIFSIRSVQKGLKFISDIKSDIPVMLHTDRHRLHQVLVNLLDNAVKFTEKGVIGLSVERQKEYLLFTVSDTGIGIAPENADRIFEKFTQADGSVTRKFGGTGLGTAICKKLIRLMGGKIWFESILGKGSTFFFTIRLSGQGKKIKQDKDGLSEKSRLKILMAEDNPLNRKLAIAILNLKGHEVVAVENGKLALELYEREPFDLILMDVQMPEMDGLEATRLIRQKEKHSGEHIPIVAMTAHGIKGDREKCLSTGMDAYLTKPIQRDIFLSTIEKAFASPAIAGDECLFLEDMPEEDDDIFNENQFMTMIGGDRKLAYELIKIYLENLLPIMIQIRDSIYNNNVKDLIFFAHSLKGMSLNLAASNVTRHARELEYIARSNDLSKAETIYDSLQQSTEALKKVLDIFSKK